MFIIFEHSPVLLEETVNYIYDDENGIYIDGTLGRGGHTKELLKRIGDDGLVISLDRDKEAIEAVKKNIGGNNQLVLVQDNFVNIPDILFDLNIDKVDGMLFDLGFSSPQIDDPERGFSYQKEGPLDMRMDRSQSFTASDIVNNYSQKEIRRIIEEYGEENWAARIADFIVKNREHGKIETTMDLVDIIKQAIPASVRRKGGHPARRTFQALRIATNNELKQLKEMINRAVDMLEFGGRIAIISFHSLEDRIVKHNFRKLASNCVCPPDFPICVCDKVKKVKIITRSPVQPGEEEIKNNARARSAKMRVAEKVLKHKAGE